MLRQKKKGQSSLEYVVIIVILVGAFVGIRNYLKRGMQGRLQSAIEGLGDQYDPRTADTRVQHRLSSRTNTDILAYNASGGHWTKRTDESFMREEKTGYTAVGAY